jgi:Domain of unknown function (DUF4167)
MRPGQNKRMRGRNNRKGPNPLTRTYESNGPDVKIRGTAHHVAEKYLQLARDAQSSGDPVMAESYLQHAEHYFRIIAAAQLAQQQAQMGFGRPPGEVEAEDGDDEEDIVPDRFASPIERFPQPNFPNPQPAQQPPAAFNPAPPPPVNQPQPFIDRPAFNGDRQHGQPRGDRNGYLDRPERSGPRFASNRPPREGREQRPQRDYGSGPREQRTDARPVEFEEQPSLPAFITAPPRLPQEQAPVPAPAADAAAPEARRNGDQEDAAFHLRPRRRRRPRPDSATDQESSASDATVSGDLSFGK